MPRICALVFLLASCAVQPPTSTESFVFKSREWIRPSMQDLTATIRVDRLSPDLYVTQYTFADPVGPLSGINPASFHIFAGCVAAKLAAQNQRQYWSLGTATPDLKYNQTREVELFVAVTNSNTEHPLSDSKARKIHWLLSPTRVSDMRQTCDRILRED